MAAQVETASQHEPASGANSSNAGATPVGRGGNSVPLAAASSMLPWPFRISQCTLLVGCRRRAEQALDNLFDVGRRNIVKVSAAKRRKKALDGAWICEWLSGSD
jgi:hypothetical protein